MVNAQVLVLNGPNLTVLGERDPAVYGTTTLEAIERMTGEAARGLGLEISWLQSNHEGVLVDTIHEWRRDADAVIVNAGAYSHTSIAIMDALAVLAQPVIEVHLSNVHAREEFRRGSYVSLVADAVIAGAGPNGYSLALCHVASLLSGGHGE